MRCNAGIQLVTDCSLQFRILDACGGQRASDGERGVYQRVNGNCFNAPAVGTQGGQNFPYMSTGAYFDNDLAIYRAFRVPGREGQQVQLRASAFNWLNHPIPGFSGSGGGSPLGIAYNVDYASKNITKNYNVNTFGIQDSKTGAPFQRIITLSVKYFF